MIRRLRAHAEVIRERHIETDAHRNAGLRARVKLRARRTNEGDVVVSNTGEDVGVHERKWQGEAHDGIAARGQKAPFPSPGTHRRLRRIVHSDIVRLEREPRNEFHPDSDTPGRAAARDGPHAVIETEGAVLVHRGDAEVQPEHEVGRGRPSITAFPYREPMNCAEAVVLGFRVPSRSTAARRGLKGRLARDRRRRVLRKGLRRCGEHRERP